MLQKRTTTSVIALAVWASLAACARVEEPWVSEGSPLEKDRGRPPAQQAELRDRLGHTQGDR